MSSSSPLYWLAIQHFDEGCKRKQSESFLNEPEQTIWFPRHKTLRTQYLLLGVFPWKQYIILANYKDLQNATFLFMYSFTTLLFRHLPTEIFIFINVCYPIQCFSGDSFSFFSEQVPIIFQLLSWFHVQFKQGTPRHYNILNSTFEAIYQVPRKEFGFVLNMICFQFFLHCLVQPNQVIYFLFHMILIVRLLIF